MIELLRAKDVAARLKIGVSTVWLYVKTGRLPAPTKWGTATVWNSRDIDAFIDQVTGHAA